jgi:peptidase E
MSINYFCSGFDQNNAFWPEFASQLKQDIKKYERIIYIPGSTKPEKVDKAINYYIPAFTQHLKNIGIEFKDISCITPDMKREEAQNLVRNSNMIFLLGGNTILQQELINSKNLYPIIRNYNGVVFGFSAGAMNMSKYIIIPPRSKENPDFDIRPALNLSGLSIYPHNNFNGEEFPEEIALDEQVTKTKDLVKIASDYEPFYLLQDNLNKEGEMQVSLIRATSDKFEILTNNGGRVWLVTKDGVSLVSENNAYKRK